MAAIAVKRGMVKAEKRIVSGHGERSELRSLGSVIWFNLCCLCT